MSCNRHDNMLVHINLHPASPPSSSATLSSAFQKQSKSMEMEKIMGCQIPAFGLWNYCHDLSITQYFDSAMQARLIKRWSHRGDGAENKGSEQLALFRSYSFQRKPPQIKVIRREVGKHCNGGELPQDGGVKAEVGTCFSSNKQVGAGTVDLYKMRKVVWSMWIGCLGLDCIV